MLFSFLSKPFIFSFYKLDIYLFFAWCFPLWVSARLGAWTARLDRWWPTRSWTCWQNNDRFPWLRCTQWKEWPGNHAGRNQGLKEPDHHPQLRLQYAKTTKTRQFVEKSLKNFQKFSDPYETGLSLVKNISLQFWHLLLLWCLLWYCEKLKITMAKLYPIHPIPSQPEGHRGILMSWLWTAITFVWLSHTAHLSKRENEQINNNGSAKITMDTIRWLESLFIWSMHNITLIYIPVWLSCPPASWGWVLWLRANMTCHFDWHNYKRCWNRRTWMAWCWSESHRNRACLSHY